MKNIINAAIQIVPHSNSTHPYDIVDDAIKVIQDSGLRYQVTPMETVVEGKYDEIMAVFKAAQEASFLAGGEELVVSIRLHVKRDADISFESKVAKFA